MAIAVTAINTAINDKGAGACTVNLTAGCTAGDVYIICYASQGAYASDTAGVSAIYYGAGDYTNGSAGIAGDARDLVAGSAYCSIYRVTAAKNTSWGGTYPYITYKSTASAATAIAVFKMTGAEASPKDKSNSGNGTGITASTGSSGTLTQNAELVIACSAVNDEVDDAHGSWTAGVGYVSGNEQFNATNGAGDASNIQVHAVARIVSDGTTQAYQGVDGAHDSVAWAACICSYKELTAAVPTVTIQDFTLAAQTTITFNGNITDGGGSTITERGVCYNTTGAPTTADSTAHDHTDATGAYTEQMTSLTAGTTYHCKAYAINTTGTGYSTESDFVAPYLHSLLMMGVGI